MMNQCRHRGMKVCHADSGNTRAFTCPYHGWAYGVDGVAIGAAGKGSLSRQAGQIEMGPGQGAPRRNYKGLIFGNWDETAPDLSIIWATWPGISTVSSTGAKAAPKWWAASTNG
jgi:3-phenylpropionate/trans-cinnamate dioxygenase alpha subunit